MRRRSSLKISVREYPRPISDAEGAFQRIAQDAGSHLLIDGRHVLRHPRAAPAFADEPVFLLQVYVRTRNRIRRDAEIVGELTHRRECGARCEVAALYGRANLLFDLLVRRDLDVRVDGNCGCAHALAMVNGRVCLTKTHTENAIQRASENANAAV